MVTDEREENDQIRSKLMSSSEKQEISTLFTQAHCDWWHRIRKTTYKCRSYIHAWMFTLIFNSFSIRSFFHCPSLSRSRFSFIQIQHDDMKMHLVNQSTKGIILCITNWLRRMEPNEGWHCSDFGETPKTDTHTHTSVEQCRPEQLNGERNMIGA